MPASQLLPARTTPTEAWNPADWRSRPIVQQPRWRDRAELAAICDYLAELPALTTPEEVDRLHTALARVQAGEALLVQGGDCVEPFGAAAVDGAHAKRRALGALAERIDGRAGVPVVTVGRLAGQYAKPRSEDTEKVQGMELPVFRGPMVNNAGPSLERRAPDPYRLLTAYYSARQVLRELCGSLWSSHEALILDYEEALTRRDPHTGARYLLSTHLPWIGQRTRQLDGAHVAFLARVANPVQVKIGTDLSPQDAVRLCGILDPGRVPGRLTLIARMGADGVRRCLPGIIEAVRAAGHPVIWATDPMHGNTVKTAGGRKTRYLTAVHAEVQAFFEVVQGLGEWPGGVHLELAAADVTECVGGTAVPTEHHLSRRYETLCDPRLNEEQAAATADLIAGLLAAGR